MYNIAPRLDILLGECEGQLEGRHNSGVIMHSWAWLGCVKGVLVSFPICGERDDDTGFP